MQSLRRYIREVITESRFNQMSKKNISMLKGHLASGNFMNVDAAGDYDTEYSQLSSEAQETLLEELNDYFDIMFPPTGNISLEIIVEMIPTLPSEGAEKVVKRARYWYDGLHNIGLVLASMDEGETLSELGNVAQKVYEVVSHELLHYMQFMKYAKGNPSKEVWNKFKKIYEDGNVASSGPEYFFFDQEDGPSEMEAFSHQIANEIRRDMKKSEANNLINSLIAVMRTKSIDLINAKEFKRLLEMSPSLRNMKKNKADFSKSQFLEMLKRIKHYSKNIN